MDELNRLLQDVEKLRKQLYELINKKQADLHDPEIVSASQILNAAITKCNEIISKKLNSKKE